MNEEEFSKDGRLNSLVELFAMIDSRLSMFGDALRIVDIEIDDPFVFFDGRLSGMLQVKYSRFEYEFIASFCRDETSEEACNRVCGELLRSHGEYDERRIREASRDQAERLCDHPLPHIRTVMDIPQGDAVNVFECDYRYRNFLIKEMRSRGDSVKSVARMFDLSGWSITEISKKDVLGDGPNSVRCALLDAAKWIADADFISLGSANMDSL